MAIPPNTRLGRYEIRSLLGAGGMGEVYLADDLNLHRRVAVKVLRVDLTTNMDGLRRFEREARAASSLNHPNILTIHEIGYDDELHFIVTEFIDGESLRQQLKREALKLPDVLEIGIQVASALAAAHAVGIVHRDIKPDNIMLRRDRFAKILDFGLAKLTERLADDFKTKSDYDTTPGTEYATTPGVVMGTARYMSPEQARGLPVDARTDIWSLGIVLYEMASGVSPFSGETLSDVLVAVLTTEPPALTRYAPDIPADMQRIVTKALRKNLDERYQSVEELRVDLTSLKRRLEFEAELARSSGGSVRTGGVKPEVTDADRTGTIQLEPVATDSAVSHIHERSSAQFVVGQIKRHRLGAVLVLAAIITATVAGWLYWGSSKVAALTDKDTVVLADFINTTGDSIFDGTLRRGLASQLEQSPFLSLVTDDRIASTLALMNRPKDARLTQQLAREVGQRTGSKATIEGSISGLGSYYELRLTGVDCRSGDVLAEVQEEANGREQVVRALGNAAAKLRTKLGESLASVQKYDAAAEDVTTGSLEALQAYSLGYQAARVNQDFKGAIPLFERAVGLDPNFALAYAALAINYGNVRDTTQAADSGRRAYELRQRVSERERLNIEAAYEINITENYEGARKAYELWAQTFPRDDVPLNNLGAIYMTLGELEKALSAYQESLRLDPGSGIAYGNILAAYLGLNRLDEAKATIREAQAHNLDFPNMHRVLYVIGFLQQDRAGMEREATLLVSKPGFEALGLYLESETAAYHGQMARARELARRVVDDFQRKDIKEIAGGFLAQAALREALVGNLELAKRQAEEARRLSDNRYIEAVTATALGLVGDSARATRVADDLALRYPENTSIQVHYLPMIRLAVAIGDLNTDSPVEASLVRAKYDLGSPSWMTFITLYPVYLRGRAYLAARQGTQAATEFQKILDHSGLVANEPIGSLAHLGLGRAYAIAGDTAQARTAYQDFFALWKDADPDIPILKEARAEYEKLK